MSGKSSIGIGTIIFWIIIGYSIFGGDDEKEVKEDNRPSITPTIIEDVKDKVKDKVKDLKPKVNELVNSFFEEVEKTDDKEFLGQIKVPEEKEKEKEKEPNDPYNTDDKYGDIDDKW